MGDPLIDLEERLGQLVPRDLSEDARVRLDSEIDRLVGSVESPSSSQKGRALAVVAAAACVVVSLSLFFMKQEPVKSVEQRLEPNVPSEEVSSSPEVQYLGSQVYVTEMTDDGWGLEEGAEQPVRYWISMVTETEALLDSESGYQIQVVSEREMVEPIALTHL